MGYQSFVHIFKYIPSIIHHVMYLLVQLTLYLTKLSVGLDCSPTFVIIEIQSAPEAKLPPFVSKYFRNGVIRLPGL